MSEMVEIICLNRRCGEKKMVRKADVKRGWGLYCSKSCKAIVQSYGTSGFKKVDRLGPGEFFAVGDQQGDHGDHPGDWEAKL